jgi:predicted Zn-dependent protease
LANPRQSNLRQNPKAGRVVLNEEMNLDQKDIHHLNAALGWLGLGDWQSANDELDNIPAAERAHPLMLSVRYAIYAKGEKWDGASEIAGALMKLTPELPDVWINFAYATRRKTGGGIPQAKEILTEARLKFPKEYLIAYNLACYECQLGNRKRAMLNLEEAFDLAGKKDIRQMALNDPDLEPLRKDISEILI